MNADRYAELFPDGITQEQLDCSRFLERQGKRFMVDFVYKDAPVIVLQQLNYMYCEGIQ